MTVGKQILGIIVRIYTYIALLMFFSGVIGGAWWAMNAGDKNILSVFF